VLFAGTTVAYAQNKDTGIDISIDIIEIDGADFIAATDDAILEAEGFGDFAVHQNETGAITWVFNVPSDGFFRIQLTYHTVPGRGSPVERHLLINGELPVREAGNIQFARMFSDLLVDGGFEADYFGNHIRPGQEEVFGWQTSYVRDVTGFISRPLEFFLEAGVHELTLESVREPVVIGRISLIRLETVAIPTYEEYLAAARAMGFGEVQLTEPIRIAAEFPHLRSCALNSPVADITSGTTYPSNPGLVLMNALGGANWQIPGRWVEWVVDVPQSGLYAIHARYLQNTHFGLHVYRTLYINGEIPFAEAERLRFYFGNNWQMSTFGGTDEPFLFLLEEGRNTIRLEVNLGPMSYNLYALDQAINTLNDIYIDLVRIMGLEPDLHRDFNLDAQVPHLLEELLRQGEVLQAIGDSVFEASGRRGEFVSLINRTAAQIEEMGTRHRTIPVSLAMFRQNISGLGTWLLMARNQPLLLDYILIQTPSNAPPRAEGNIFQRIWFEIRRFTASFFVDSAAIGSRYSPDELGGDQSIRVWMALGRDQALILRNMIDDTFTPMTGIPVDFQLVVGEALLTSILAGVGPDIALGNGGDVPVNFAARNALIDLSQFTGFDEVTSRFHPESLTGFTFRGGVYAMPETMSFPMFFYRTDIFEELGLVPPDSWEDMYVILTELQKQGMSFGMPPPITTLLTMMYQQGTELFTEDGRSTYLGSDVGFSAFREMTDLFTLYGVPYAFDFMNRFRSGEMPGAIVDFTAFNQLVVFAPEIRGRWAFVPVMGTWQEDENGTSFLDRSVIMAVSGAMMMNGTENPENAWEFIRWWTDADAQFRFGMEMQNLLGPAAKYNTANLEAFERLPWIRGEYDRMMDQLYWAQGLRIVPGNYIVDWSVRFAFLNVLDRGHNPNLVLLEYLGVIDNELGRRADEFADR